MSTSSFVGFQLKFSLSSTPWVAWIPRSVLRHSRNHSNGLKWRADVVMHSGGFPVNFHLHTVVNTTCTGGSSHQTPRWSLVFVGWCIGRQDHRSMEPSNIHPNRSSWRQCFPTRSLRYPHKLFETGSVGTWVKQRVFKTSPGRRW